MATATFSIFKGVSGGRPSVRKRVSGTVKTRAHSKHPTISAATFDKLTVIQQIKRAFLPGARLAAWVGLIIGGIIPVFTFTLAHFDVQAHHWHWVLVLGGLIYSAETVFHWARAAFGHPSKALGFVVLLEGVLAFCTILSLAFTALMVLVFINAIAAACALQVRKEPTPARASQSGLTTLWGN